MFFEKKTNHFLEKYFPSKQGKPKCIFKKERITYDMASLHQDDGTIFYIYNNYIIYRSKPFEQIYIT